MRGFIMQLTNAYRLQRSCDPVSRQRLIDATRTLEQKLDDALRALDAERAKRRKAEAEAIAYRSIAEQKPLVDETPASAILTIVAGLAGVPIGHLVGSSRVRCYVHPRQAAMLLMRRHTAVGKASMSEIGRVCGGRDHTTVLHSITQAEERIKNDPAFAELIAKAEAIIAGRANG